MAKTAVLSDIHANLEALDAVLADVDRQGIEEIVCLGDIVGYGPDPVACVDRLVDRVRVGVRGNHEEAVLQGPWGFHRSAKLAIEWTTRRLRPSLFRPGSRRRWRFLRGLPQSARHGDLLLVHGSPRDPISEYVLPQNVSWPRPGFFEEIFESIDGVCLVGHTHIAGIFTEGPRYTPQAEIQGSFRKGPEKMLINVGSVGQPRDGDTRACYLTCDGEEFEYHRVEYDIETTQEKIRRVAALDDRFAERLGKGT